MTRPIRFEPEALADIAGAVRYYNRERPGLGTEFRQTVNRRALALRRFPQAGRLVEHVTLATVARQVLAQPFPYLIIYVLTDHDIRVVAVAHEKRLPAFWAERLDET